MPRLRTLTPYASNPGQSQATMMISPPPPYDTASAYPQASWGRAPRYKDLRYDGTSSWKFFMLKFVRLARSQQWS
jgi:hypothetical protein